MTLIRWNPVWPHRHFDPAFDGLVKRFMDPTTNGETYTPTVDIRETENDVVLSVELPGLAKDDVNLSVEEGVLAIAGERKFAPLRDGEQSLLQESRYGRFLRRFTLGENIDPDNISASMDKGILEIRLAKKEAAKPKKIEVTIQ
ncbi:MAG: Hsp20/alpha crystallin family protein [Deltaproteobacteria bacterium]|nr:Hsp20/alpha crystallin family protein [Deltaproteobacteria bacterium]